jgi:lipopolysaccharide transport system ATP-binding protein
MNTTICLQHVSKCYQIYDHPIDRLKQFICPQLNRIIRRPTKKYYREFWAVRDVSFEIKPGETIGIVGRNGGGKSTLLQMICGTLTPTHGKIQTRGRIAALLELGSGFNPEFTGRENIYMNASLLGLSNSEIDSRFDKITTFADIGNFIDQPVKLYSSGMYVRLAFAVMAHVDADILVVDEALAVGDAFFTQKCMRFLREFKKTGTLLFVSHDTASIKSLCTKAIWLEKGQVLQEGTPKQVCESYLEAFYESQQGKVSEDKCADLIISDKGKQDSRIVEIDQWSTFFGTGGAKINNVSLIDDSGRSLSWVSGGEKVTLQIEAQAMQDIDYPLIGFYVKDRLGQSLFGDNTYLYYKGKRLYCQSNSILRADFTFYMPILPAGYYSIAVAIANGTQESHTQLHWIHDSLIFRSEANAITGLVGIPMVDINLQVVPADLT